MSTELKVCNYMFEQNRRSLWLIVLIVVPAGAFALVGGRSKSRLDRAAPTSVGSLSASHDATLQGQEPRQINKHRNLSLQPEAFKMQRRLGQRFAPDKRERSSLVGILTIGTVRRNVQTNRTQTDDGEQVEFKIEGSQGSLTWDKDRGALSSGSRSSGSDRELIERLVLDSPISLFWPNCVGPATTRWLGMFDRRKLVTRITTAARFGTWYG
jgi:hypothetical protein